MSRVDFSGFYNTYEDFIQSFATLGLNPDTGQSLDSTDPQRVVAGIDYLPADGRWRAGFALTWVDDKTQSDPATSQYLPEGYFLVDLFGKVRIGDRLKRNAGLYNVTEEKYWEWAEVRGRPATDVAIDRCTRPSRNLSASPKVEF